MYTSIKKNIYNNVNNNIYNNIICYMCNVVYLHILSNENVF